MNAKDKANFINSVAGGQKIPCPACNALNKADALFCISCGAKLSIDTTEQINVDIHEPSESVSVFAMGLPSWDIVPPQVVVRRKKRR